MEGGHGPGGLGPLQMAPTQGGFQPRTLGFHRQLLLSEITHGTGTLSRGPRLCRVPQTPSWPYGTWVVVLPKKKRAPSHGEP